MRLTGESPEVPVLRAQAEAAAWIALLHSPERTPEIEAGLRRWIAADPLHAAAWEAASDIWNETAGLPRRIPLRKVVWYRSRRAVLTPLLAAAAVGLIVAGALVQPFLRFGVSTSVGEQRTLNLEDGTRVALNTDSHIVVRYDREMRTVILKSGEAYFQVARDGRPFTVIAGDRKVLALGTAFTVRRDDAGADDSLTVTLLEGRIAVEPVDTPAASAPSASDIEILNPGQQLRVRGHTVATVAATSTEKATGWMRGQLIFDHTPLRDAVAEFNRYSSTKITIASASAGSIPVGGIFRISDSRSFARAVAETHGLRLTLRDNSLVLDNPAVDSSPTSPAQP